jgi:hypothetical protein
MLSIQCVLWLKIKVSTDLLNQIVTRCWSQLWVKKRRTNSEHNGAASTPTADIQADIRLRCCRPQVVIAKAIVQTADFQPVAW